MFPGVDTSRFISFIRKLVHDKSNILICEGISSVLCNISVLKQIQMIGYKLHIIELNTPLDECIHNLIRRNDYTIKTKKKVHEWQKKNQNTRQFHCLSIITRRSKNFLLHSVNQVKNRDLEKNVKIFFNTTNSFEVTLQKVKSTLYSIDLKSKQLKNKNKNWMFQKFGDVSCSGSSVSSSQSFSSSSVKPKISDSFFRYWKSCLSYTG